MTHGDAREGKWKGNWRMEWVASTLTLPRNVVYPALLTPMRTPRLPAVDWTDVPTDLNGLVCFGERRNLVSVRVPSRFRCSLQLWYSSCMLYDWPEDDQIRSKHDVIINCIIHTTCVGRYLRPSLKLPSWSPNSFISLCEWYWLVSSPTCWRNVQFQYTEVAVGPCSFFFLPFLCLSYFPLIWVILLLIAMQLFTALLCSFPRDGMSIKVD